MFPEDDAPAALALEDARDSDACCEAEADAAEAELAEAEEADMLANTELGNVVWTTVKCVWVDAAALKLMVLGVMAK